MWAPSYQDYPSRYLRILFNVEVLRLLRFDEPNHDGSEASLQFRQKVEDIESAWKKLYPGRHHPMKEFEDDLVPARS